MKILITGGSGYLASSLAYYFSNKSLNTILCSRNKDINIKKNTYLNLKYINWNSECDLEKLCKGVDIVIHAAGMNSKDSQKDPIGADECNHINTRNLSTAASLAKVKKFIYISTVHVYRSELDGVIDENIETSNPHPYALSHRLGEIAAIQVSNNSTMQTYIIRLSNVFGAPAQNNLNCWDLLVNNLCREAIKNNTITINTDGTESRDFISIESFNNAVEYIFKSKITESSKIINVGSGDSYSVISIAKIIKNQYEKIFKKEIKIINKKKVKYNNNLKFSYIIDNLKKTGYKPSSDISEDIKFLLLYCHNRFKK